MQNKFSLILNTFKVAFSKLSRNKAVLFWFLFGGGVILFFLSIHWLVKLSNYSGEIEVEASDNLDSLENNSPSVAQDLGVESETGILVELAGAFVNPGIYSLRGDEARLFQFVDMAEGFHLKADKSYIRDHINLARKTVDGEKVYVPFDFENYQGAVQTPNLTLEKGDLNNDEQVSSDTKKISVNQASKVELLSLIGVGEVRANNIIENRPYESLDELVEKKIISKKILDDNNEELSL